MEKKEKVVVIGLDGVSLELVKKWAGEGRLPVLNRLMKEGVYGRLLSVPDHSSPAAWTSFSTGRNSAKHGIYNFLDLIPHTFRMHFLNSTHRDGETIWSLLNKRGKKTGICNIPMSYPADKVDGFMITGWNAPTIQSPGFTHPPELIEELLEKFGDYPLFPSVKKYIAQNRPDLAVEELHRHFDITAAATMHLMKTRRWDFFTSVIVTTDQAQHYFWHYMDPDHPEHDPDLKERWGKVIPDIYGKCDKFIGEVLETLDEDTTVIIMSDHGNCPNHRGVSFMPGLLKALGLLHEKSSSPASLLKNPLQAAGHYAGIMLKNIYQLINRRLSIKLRGKLSAMFPSLRNKVESTWRYSAYDWSRTKAYFHFQPRINLKGREPNGIVSPGREYEEVRDYIINKLYECRDIKTGQKVVEKVFKREEVYKGKYIESAPDMVIWWKEGVVISGLTCKGDDGADITVDEIYETDLRTGNHTPFGIFIAKGKNIKSGLEIKNAEIIDLAPTILHLMGSPIPKDMDGKVLEEIFTDEFLKSNHINYMEEKDDSGESKASNYNESDEKKVEDHLRGLGYLE